MNWFKKIVTVSSTLSALTSAMSVTLITPTNITLTTGTSTFSLQNLINNSGLSGTATANNFTTITETAGASNEWVTNAPGNIGSDYFNLAPNPVLVVNLDNLYNIQNMVFWGYTNQSQSNEARSFSLEFSVDNGATYGSAINISNPLNNYASSNAVSLAASGVANTIRITITDNHFGGTAVGGDRVGFGELKFLATATPEPFAVTLIILGSLPLVLCRKRL